MTVTSTFVALGIGFLAGYLRETGASVVMLGTEAPIILRHRVRKGAISATLRQTDFKVVIIRVN